MTEEFAPEFDAIAAVIGERTGVPFTALSVSPVGGGSIHRAWRLDDGIRQFFVKTNGIAAAPMFAAEAQGLQALSATGVVSAPTFVAGGETETAAFLVLDYLELAALDRDGGVLLGTALAQLHRITGDAFGWTHDNFIGATPQHNAPHPSWPHFFGERRLRPQVQLARQNGMDKALAAKAYAVIEHIGGLFID